MKSCEIDCSKIEEESNFYHDYYIKKEVSTIISDSLLPTLQTDNENNEPIMEQDSINVEEEILISLDSTINEHTIDSTNFVKSASTTIEKTKESTINESTITPDPTNIEKPISTLNRITTIPDSKILKRQ